MKYIYTNSLTSSQGGCKGYLHIIINILPGRRQKRSTHYAQHSLQEAPTQEDLQIKHLGVADGKLPISVKSMPWRMTVLSLAKVIASFDMARQVKVFFSEISCEERGSGLLINC